MIILIDNGHGIETPGKRSPDGRFKEYLWNREVAENRVSQNGPAVDTMRNHFGEETMRRVVLEHMYGVI